jgi:hypothetical protein
MATIMIGKETHKEFIKHLNKSQPAVDLLEKIFIDLGYEVEKPELQISPTPEARAYYFDSGDLFVTKDLIRNRVEVKEVGIKFSGRVDWKFSNFIICGKKSFDRAQPKPWLYIIVSQDHRAFGFVYTSTYHRWFSKWMPDKRYGPEYKALFYLCELDNVTFRKVDKKYYA